MVILVVPVIPNFLFEKEHPTDYQRVQGKLNTPGEKYCPDAINGTRDVNNVDRNTATLCKSINSQILSSTNNPRKVISSSKSKLCSISY